MYDIPLANQLADLSLSFSASGTGDQVANAQLLDEADPIKTLLAAKKKRCQAEYLSYGWNKNFKSQASMRSGTVLRISLSCHAQIHQE